MERISGSDFEISIDETELGASLGLYRTLGSARFDGVPDVDDILEL